MEHDAEEDGEQCGYQDAPLLDAVGNGEASPDLADLHAAGGGW